MKKGQVKKVPVKEPTAQELEKRYRQLTIKDDFMFGKIMQNESNCIEMLRRLTGNHIKHVKSVTSQKSIRVVSDAKGVRYDVYVEDDVVNTYDAELQQKNEPGSGVLPKRARYYQGMMDLNVLNVGEAYNKLANSYVIFICTYDLFGKGLCCYEFENICKDNPELSLNDGRKILIFNTKGTVVNVREEVLDFLRFIENNETRDEYTRRLYHEVNNARVNKEWQVEYVKTLIHDYDIKREGIEIGNTQKLISQICSKLLKGKSVDVIADEVEEDYGVVDEICVIANKFAPDFQSDLVFEAYMEKHK